ncbi:endoplasmic reticulum-Golgi intermediate compartment protein 2-like [Salvelinus sp. IW2-2015]|uniref:endoplasmic reticulum-Golgi intermediate compartment protein 2-like n=1 Tax=Salvelinus sp. IW2-2015 TaxID=2691554 RepID=UPI0038D42029
MRRLYRKKALSLVKELDAFPKVPESYVETTATGGTVSLIAFTAMALLAFFEFFVYRDTWMKYEYEVDKDFSSKLRINIDITVAMKCQHVGADILDLAETMITSNGIQYEPVIFELTPQQKLWHRTLLLIQNRLREEHSLQEVLYKSVLKGAPPGLPPRICFPTKVIVCVCVFREGTASAPLSACRIHGHVYVNKVAGNFHITVGKPIHHPRGHAHIAAFVSHDTYNFSHRIDHLSFGEEIPGIINPLDGTEKITSNHNEMFQYFITVVPTKLHTSKVSADTHQFSVTERVSPDLGTDLVSACLPQILILTIRGKGIIFDVDHDGGCCSGFRCSIALGHYADSDTATFLHNGSIDAALALRWCTTEPVGDTGHKRAGSHGVSGIFMKYDTSSLMVTVSEQHMPLWQFLVRLCGIIGGIFSTTGMIHGFVGFCFDIVCCRFKLGPYKPREVVLPDPHVNNCAAPLLTDNHVQE